MVGASSILFYNASLSKPTGPPTQHLKMRCASGAAVGRARRPRAALPGPAGGRQAGGGGVPLLLRCAPSAPSAPAGRLPLLLHSLYSLRLLIGATPSTPSLPPLPLLLGPTPSTPLLLRCVPPLPQLPLLLRGDFLYSSTPSGRLPPLPQLECHMEDDRVHTHRAFAGVFSRGHAVLHGELPAGRLAWVQLPCKSAAGVAYINR